MRKRLSIGRFSRQADLRLSGHLIKFIDCCSAARMVATVTLPVSEARRSVIIDRGFTDDEAKVILRAALEATDPVRRWVPWIGAYTGARISEICQLRAEDVVKVDDIWCMKFDPEAGSLKTSGSERIIPVHPALIENGFLKFATTVKSGPLFADLTPDKFG